MNTYAQPRSVMTLLCGALVLLSAVGGWGSAAMAAPPRTIHEAQHSVDDAWEAFHHAAITGTLKSPDVQSRVERDLHLARELLVKAREAADRRDRRTVDGILKRLDELTARAIVASREPKP